MERAPRDGADAQVESGELALSGLLELLGRGGRLWHGKNYGGLTPDLDGPKYATFGPDPAYEVRGFVLRGGP